MSDIWIYSWCLKFSIKICPDVSQQRSNLFVHKAQNLSGLRSTNLGKDNPGSFLICLTRSAVINLINMSFIMLCKTPISKSVEKKIPGLPVTGNLEPKNLQKRLNLLQLVSQGRQVSGKLDVGFQVPKNGLVSGFRRFLGMRNLWKFNSMFTDGQRWKKRLPCC